MLTCQGHTSCEQQRETLKFYKDCRNVRHYLPRRLENKTCGTLLFLCFRNLILVRISAYAVTQIWLGAMSFSFACSWNDGMFHRTWNTFPAKIFKSKVQHQRVFSTVRINWFHKVNCSCVLSRIMKRIYKDIERQYF